MSLLFPFAIQVKVEEGEKTTILSSINFDFVMYFRSGYNQYELIKSFIEFLVEKGLSRKELESFKQIDWDSDSLKGKNVILIPIEENKILGEVTKITTTLNSNLLERIDSVIANKENGFKSRSDFFTKLALKELSLIEKNETEL